MHSTPRNLPYSAQVNRILCQARMTSLQRQWVLSCTENCQRITEPFFLGQVWLNRHSPVDFPPWMTSLARTWLSSVTSHLRKHSEFLNRYLFTLRTLRGLWRRCPFPRRKWPGPAWRRSPSPSRPSPRKRLGERRGPHHDSERTRTRWVHSATHDTPPSQRFCFGVLARCLMDLFTLSVNICAQILTCTTSPFPTALIHNHVRKQIRIYHNLD